MLKSDVTVLYEPTKLVRASGRVPSPLIFTDLEGDKQQYVIEPLIEGADMTTAKIFYTMPSKFARQILSDPRKIYFLSIPDRMTVPFREKNIHDVVWRLVKSCGQKPKSTEQNEEDLEKLMMSAAALSNDEKKALREGKLPPHLQKTLNELNKEKLEKETEEAEKKEAEGKGETKEKGGDETPKKQIPKVDL